jgi:hypothetical protein
MGRSSWETMDTLESHFVDLIVRQSFGGFACA